MDTPAKEMLEKSERILALYPAQDLTPGERIRRIMKLRGMAQVRWAACQAKLPADALDDPALQQLVEQWKSHSGIKPGGMRDPAVQQEKLKLIYATEVETAQFCGVPGGDDALVLLMAQSPATVEQ